MGRDELITLLADGGAAATLCRTDLQSGAALAVMPRSVDARQLEAIYRRRAQHLEDEGTQSLGAFEAAEALAATTATEIALAKVEHGPSGYFFQVFLDPGLERVVACLAVMTRGD